MWGQTCQGAHLGMIESGPINEQTGLTVVINVHLPVFLMGNLIRNLLVAAGLLSYPITASLCQNLCHHQPTTPTTTTSLHPPPSCLIWHLCLRVPVMECCSPAISLQVHPVGCRLFPSRAAAVAEWPVRRLWQRREAVVQSPVQWKIGGGG